MIRRNTPNKTAILDVLKFYKSALSQEDIEKLVSEKMDRATVYRILNSFCTDGYVHKITADDGKNYFALCVKCRGTTHHHYHFHFRCLSCNVVECLNEEINFSLPCGYRVKHMNGMLTGYCSKCAD